MPFANYKSLRPGQVVWLDGGFTCHLPGPTILACDDAGELFFYCCSGKHTLDGQMESDSDVVIGVWDVEPAEWQVWQQADACPVIP